MGYYYHIVDANFEPLPLRRELQSREQIEDLLLSNSMAYSDGEELMEHFDFALSYEVDNGELHVETSESFKGESEFLASLAIFLEATRGMRPRDRGGNLGMVFDLILVGEDFPDFQRVMSDGSKLTIAQGQPSFGEARDFRGPQSIV